MVKKRVQPRFRKGDIPKGGMVTRTGNQPPVLIMPGQAPQPFNPPAGSNLNVPLSQMPTQAPMAAPAQASLPAGTQTIPGVSQNVLNRPDVDAQGNSKRSPVRRWFRNWAARPLAALLGIDVKPDWGQGVPTDDELIKFQETLPPQVRDAFDKLLDASEQRFADITSPLPALDIKELEQMAPQAIPTMEEVNATLPNLQQSDFGPIEQLARQNFEQQTIPSIAERFAGLGGLGSTAFRGELGKAGSNLESQLAALRSAHGLQQSGLELQRGELGTRRLGVLGQLGLGQQQQNAAQAQALGQLRLGGRGQQLQERGNIANLLGLQAQRPTVGYQSPGEANPFLQAGSQISQLATTLAPLLFF